MSSRGSYGGGSPVGPANGDLTGTYPNPTVTSTNLTSPLPLVQGGTGSATQNFVDVTQNQSVAGTKTFTDRVIVPSPASSTDAASKGYADGIAAGISVKNSVAVATTVALPVNTYANGTSGVGATLTATAPGILIIDGYTVLLNDRVVVKNEVAAANNGIYTLTTLGTVGVAYVLTRATDMDQSAEFNAASTFVNNGTLNKGTGWVVVGTPPYTVGTTAVNWTQFTSPGLVNVGVGLLQVGNTLSLDTPVDPSNLPPATTSTTGTIELAGDLSGTNILPTVVATHLASPLPVLQGGTGSTTASGARTNIGLGTAAVENVNTTASNTAPLGTQAAGGVGQVADAGHVHAMPRLDQVNAPTANVSLNSQKITSLSNGTASTDAAAFGQIPTTFPPSGAAGGDLTGTYPNPTVVATSNVNSIVRANRLDQMAAPTTSLSANNQKITNLTNGSSASDAAAFGQIPTTFPPSGPAGGDLASTYPNPTVAKVNGVTVSGTPTAGTQITATSATTASWQPGVARSTGILNGALLTLNSATSIHISAGKAQIVDYTTTPGSPTVTLVTIADQVVNLNGTELARPINWWVADANGTITSLATQPNADQRRSLIQIGITAENAGSIVVFDTAPIYVADVTSQLYDLMFALGTFVSSGAQMTTNGANLSLNLTAGTVFVGGRNYKNDISNPHNIAVPVETPITFRHILSTGAGLAPTSTVDVGHYDNAGVLTAVGGGANTSTVMRVFLFGTGQAGNQVLIQYGDQTFGTLSAAALSIGSTPYTVNPSLASGTLIGWLIVSKSSTSLQDTATATLLLANRFDRP